MDELCLPVLYSKHKYCNNASAELQTGISDRGLGAKHRYPKARGLGAKHHYPKAPLMKFTPSFQGSCKRVIKLNKRL